MSHYTAPRIGIAPDSWGVWFPDHPSQPTAEQYLSEVQEVGFRWSEIGPWGFLGTDPQKLKADFDAHNLLCSGGTAVTSLHRAGNPVDEAWKDISEIAGALVTLGAEHLIVIPETWQRDDAGRVQGERAFTAEEWTRFLTNHDELGKRLLEEYGIRQMFHSHADSQVGTWGEVTRLLEGTDPRYTNLCLDTGHFAYYLGDCYGLLKEYPSRIGYLHLKQVEPTLLAEVLKNDVPFDMAVREGIMCEAGEGVPDFGPLLEEAARTTPDIFAIVEQDLFPLASTDTPKHLAATALQHIKNQGVEITLR